MGGFSQLTHRARQQRAAHKEPVAYGGEPLEITAKPKGPPITDPAERDRLLAERFDPEQRKKPAAA